MKKWFLCGLLGLLLSCSRPVRAATEVTQLVQLLWQQQVQVLPALKLAPAQQMALTATWQAYQQATRCFQQGSALPAKPTAIEQEVWQTLQTARTSGEQAGQQQARQQLPSACRPPVSMVPVAQSVYCQAYHQAYHQAYQQQKQGPDAEVPGPPQPPQPSLQVPVTPTVPIPDIPEISPKTPSLPAALPEPAEAPVPHLPQSVPHAKWRPTQAAFLKRLAPLAQRIARQYDLYPSIMLAQAALESNWGQSELAQAPYYNLFGVKATSSRQVWLATLEADETGQLQPAQAAFARYSNYRQALLAYAQLLSLPLYQGAQRQVSDTYQKALVCLAQQYATDPNYVEKVQQLIETYRLQRYDLPPRLKRHFRMPQHRKRRLPIQPVLLLPRQVRHLNWPNTQGWSFLIASWLPQHTNKWSKKIARITANTESTYYYAYSASKAA